LNCGALTLLTPFAVSVFAALHWPASTLEMDLSTQVIAPKQEPAVTNIASTSLVKIVKSANRATPTIETVNGEKQVAVNQH
jgi:hypothetical protein